jgi:hypothetical protein
MKFVDEFGGEMVGMGGNSRDVFYTLERLDDTDISTACNSRKIQIGYLRNTSHTCYGSAICSAIHELRKLCFLLKVKMFILLNHKFKFLHLGCFLAQEN